MRTGNVLQDESKEEKTMEHIEMVEKLMEKANVSYAEAKQALENNNWDMLDALIELERQGKVHGRQMLVITQTDSNAITRKNANEHAKKRLVKGISVQFKAIFKAEMQRAICKSFWAVFGLFEGSGARSTILFKKSLKPL